MESCRVLRLILGDQLNRQHSWFESTHDDVLYVICELRQEASYVRHHVQKLVAFFAAMQAFASELGEEGHRVLHLDLDETADFDDLPALLTHLLEATGAECFEYQRPDEYRLAAQMRDYCAELDLPSACAETEHFLLPFTEIGEQFPAGKSLRMEHFYRRMRKRLDILMDDEGEPEGGQWNFDADNREPLPEDQAWPAPPDFANDVAEFLDRAERHGIDTMGRLDGDRLRWPLTRDQALRALEHFLEQGLPTFGPYQDAMSRDNWHLSHSLLSFALNAKILAPLEVVQAVAGAWRDDPDRVGLASAEGFIRQVVGWREFMRGIYWANMPDYAGRNHFECERELPDYFWTGDTDMACMAAAIGQSLDHAYAHHIQRLMVIGNFCLLAGIDPDQVDAWYLGVYIDALEWVEMPNTRGMSQFADGGIVASKPYAASANYIKRMSDYCADCRYRATERSGDDACPFNSLYWHFMNRHRDELSGNPRIAMLYRSWDRMDEDVRQATLASAERYLEQLEDL